MPRGKVQVKSSSKVGSETEMECYGNDVHRMSPLSSQPEFKKFIPMPEKEPALFYSKPLLKGTKWSQTVLL